MDQIKLKGVTTNNLKKISIDIPKNSITVIYGKSGAGKSSLAFNTLYKLCRDEFEAIESGFSEMADYQLSSYEGILPAVAISQHNTNTNPRSTLYSYLKIPQVLTSLYQEKLLTPPYKLLKLNTPINECPNCHGLGQVYEIVEDDVYDEALSLEERPFNCWNTGSLKDYYNNLLIAFSKKNKIPTNIPFKDLEEVQRSTILYGESDEKISFRFKLKGRNREKRAFFIGAMDFSKQNKHLKSMDYTNLVVCPDCEGSKINKKLYFGVEILGLAMHDFLTIPFNELLPILKKDEANNNITRIVDSICEMGLGYLSLARSVPTLSGGELQKFNFSRLLNTDITGILVVIDEISSQLSGSDFNRVQSQLDTLAISNTVVLVEHNQYFIDKAAQKFHIGRKAGKLGGFICEDEEIKPFYEVDKKNKADGFYEFTNINRYNIRDQDVKVPKNCLTAFVGVSGSGKSTLASVIKDRESAFYISQRLANYTSRSILASTIQISTLIAEYFAKKTGINEGFFLPNKEGGCITCKGVGVVKYERGYDKDIYLSCPTCEGRLFDESNEKVLIKIEGCSIVDLYQREIWELVSFFEEGKITKILETMMGLELSHLSLNRKTQSLSGGELRRARMCTYFSKLRKSKKILILDEPTAGLDPNTASKVASFIYKNTSLYDSIIVIEHKPEVICYADYKVYIGPGAGSEGGRIVHQGFE